MIVVDTCALLYWTLEPARLSPAARHALGRLGPGASGLVCSASVWEIAVKVRRGRLALGMSLGEYLDGLARLPIEMVSVDTTLWIDSVDLAWDHGDPVDRLVVALGRRRDVDIVTSDGAIRRFHPRTVW